MAKSNITNEIALYIKNDTTCKFVVSGLTLAECKVIDDTTRPTLRKSVKTLNTIYITVWYGTENAEPIGNRQIRRYTTTINIYADTEVNLQLAIEELRTVFYCWENQGGGVFQTSGTSYHRVLSFDTDMRGRESAQVLLTLQSKLEAKPV